MTVISTIAAQNGYFGFYTLGQMTLEFSAAAGNDQARSRAGIHHGLRPVPPRGRDTAGNQTHQPR